MQRRTIKQLLSKVPKEKKKGAWKKWLFLIPVLVLFSAVFYVVNLPQYQITNVMVKGVLLAKESDIKSVTNQELSGSYLFFIPKSFFVFYPKDAIREKVEAMSSVLSTSLDFEKSSQTLTINIVERKQEYVWCTDDTLDGSAETKECFYMDKDGLVFIAAPQFEGHVFLMFAGLLDGADPVGKHFLPAAKMTEVLDFIVKLKTLGLSVASVSAKSEREIHMRLRSGTDLVVSLEKPLSDVVKNISTLIASTDFTTASGGIDKVSYIDLRYGTKAFWKER